MAQLYQPDGKRLVAGENGADSAFNDEVFERAAEWIREKGGFSPEMLKEQPALDVIAETFRVLDSAVSSSIPKSMPGDLVGLLENNAFIFSGLKSYHSLSEVGLSLVGKDGGIKPYDEFQEEVVKINETYNRNYLEAEYNHAVASSQMASKWHEFEADGDRYDLQYRTAGDDKVREEHALLHNITLPPNDPFWAQFLPPNGWNCRCTVVQVRKGRYTPSDSVHSIEVGERITAEPKQQMFRFNPGKELKIYPDKHPYNKAPKQAKDIAIQFAEERAIGLRKQVDVAVRAWIREHLPENGVVESKAFETGEVKFGADSIKRYLGHAPNMAAKWMLRHILERPETMKYVRFSPLGATKDMSNPAHIKNVAKKENRHVMGYNIYEFEYRGEIWIIGFEKIKRGKTSYEQPYFIKKKKP